MNVARCFSTAICPSVSTLCPLREWGGVGRKDHQNSEGQFGREYDLDEDSLGGSDTGTDASLHVEPVARHERLGHAGGHDAGDELGEDEQHTLDGRHQAQQDESQRQRGVEEAPGDAVEEPGVDGKRDGEGQRDVQQQQRRRAGRRAVGVLGRLHAAEGRAEEQESAQELARLASR